MAFALTLFKCTIVLIMQILLFVNAFSSHVKIFKRPMREFGDIDTNNKIKFYFTSRGECGYLLKCNM